VDEFGAEFEGEGPGGVVEGVDSAADAVARFEEGEGVGCVGEGVGGGKPGGARAEDEDVGGMGVGHGGW
jgi:hypothetical protein